MKKKWKIQENLGKPRKSYENPRGLRQFRRGIAKNLGKTRKSMKKPQKSEIGSKNHELVVSSPPKTELVVASREQPELVVASR